MHYLIGDQSGLIKNVEIPQAPSKSVKRKRDDKGEPIKPAPIVQVWGPLDKNASVDQITWCVEGGSRSDQFLVARRGGRVSRMSSQTGQVLESFATFQPSLDEKGQLKLNKHRQPDRIIGISHEDGSILSCSNTGLVHLNRISSKTDTTSEYDYKDFSASLNQDMLFRMRTSPSNMNLFATGGDERDLCIWDLNNMQKEGATIEPIFKAKNVPHDFLDLRVPIWITDLQYLTPSQLVTCTGYHQVRLYDMKAGKKPVMSCEVGDTSLRTVTVLNANEVLVTDTTGELTSLDVRQAGK
ncbi:hypothetical protein SmJEL517_g05360 [Synchytrium microbalum]|uniref:Ribosome biogenesis protein NSA1 n=1 Tax=Synchytrium microbalum TaxID=1806994 RepID=A0A507C150_9FUNG|nr:uncharacterized protein SmJEL517_g05360 [Synchytrium microbalum]TPX31233.1 hypothetical protein SmJEL517_g05360 [Synchytrium microbalum]